MSWFGKKKANPNDGDFPHVPKHYREEKVLTRTIKPAPPIQWVEDTTVVWGIDIGPANTTVAFAYLEPGRDVEVHNIIYWPKVFPLRESTTEARVPELKSNKTFKLRETYESTGFVSHPAWNSERTANYVHVVNTANSSTAFQVRTDLPFVETSERHKYLDLVEHLLKHALAVYGAVIKKNQEAPVWPRSSDLVVTLPSGMPTSAGMTIVGELDAMVERVMPKVIGPTRVLYVLRPDLRLFEDNSWRNLDTNFQNDDTFMLVDWDLETGDMVCASYKVQRLLGGQVTFGTRLRSYMQASPVLTKRDPATDAREGARFANALHWCAENKHRTQKLIIRTSNPFKKSDSLLSVFHKSLVEKGLQVGIRSVAQETENGAFGAIMWRVAHITEQKPGDNEELALVHDMTALSVDEVNSSAPEPDFSPEPEQPSKMARALSSLQTGVLSRLGKEKAKEDYGTPFQSPVEKSTSALGSAMTSSSTPATPLSPLSQTVTSPSPKALPVPSELDKMGSSSAADPVEEDAIPPPAYNDDSDNKDTPRPLEKVRV